MERQIDGGTVGPHVAVSVVLGALQGCLLALLHAQECLFGCLLERAQHVGADHVIDAGTLFNDCPVRCNDLHRQFHLVRLLGSLPACTLLELGFDDALIAEEVVLGGPAQQLDLEDQCGFLRDLRGRARVAIGKLRCQGELGHLALAHRGNAKVPAFDDLTLAQGEDEGLAAAPRGVELAAVGGQRPYIVDSDLVTRLGLLPVLAGCLLDDLLLDALRELGRRLVVTDVVALGALIEAGITAELGIRHGHYGRATAGRPQHGQPKRGT
mmetsp:Transcript_71845/g.232509  ORF Transcript_71845/g.232509 Transcript_71845/m.232509 type:complete len:268 (-) Transcript_71845:2-805(-)